MYQVIRRAGARSALARETVPGVAAFEIAEFFYKFHSFSLECLAFLATWFVLSWVYACLVPERESRPRAQP